MNQLIQSWKPVLPCYTSDPGPSGTLRRVIQQSIWQVIQQSCLNVQGSPELSQGGGWFEGNDTANVVLLPQSQSGRLLSLPLAFMHMY